MKLLQVVLLNKFNLDLGQRTEEAEIHVLST